MEKKNLDFEGRKVIIYEGKDPSCLIIHPSDEHEMTGMDSMISLMTEEGENFILAAFQVNDWNDDLSPWFAPAVFGKDDFGGKAAETLEYVEKLAEKMEKHPDLPVIIGGYSLAGLFALWAGYQSDTFAAVAAMSPSVWFDGWKEYMEANEIKTKIVYLSLGDREEITRNKRMAKVGENIRQQKELLEKAGIKCILQWNPGNHFRDFDRRCSDGYNWCRRNICLYNKEEK